MFPSRSHCRFRTSKGAADMTISFFTTPDVNGTVFFVGNSASTRKEGTITSKRGSRLRHCGYGLAVRRKRLVKLLRISPFGSNGPNILFDNSIVALLTVRRSSITPIFNPLVINNNKIRSFNSFTCVFSFYSSNPHSFRFSLTTLIYFLIITPFVRNLTPSLRRISV